MEDNPVRPHSLLLFFENDIINLNIIKLLNCKFTQYTKIYIWANTCFDVHFTQYTFISVIFSKSLHLYLSACVYKLTWLLISALFCRSKDTSSLWPRSHAQCRSARPLNTTNNYHLLLKCGQLAYVNNVTRTRKVILTVRKHIFN